MSGIADCAPVTYGGPDSATASITATCQDQAGNAANRSFALKYDSTPPAVAGSQAARPADAGGWYNHPVAVVVHGRRPGVRRRGVHRHDLCRTRRRLRRRAGDLHRQGRQCQPLGRLPAPLRRHEADRDERPGGARPGCGRLVQPRRLRRLQRHRSDGRDRGCQTLPYAGPDSGVASVAGTCRDHAGNVSNPFAYGLKYDATAPAVTAADPDRAANANGWYNRSVAYHDPRHRRHVGRGRVPRHDIQRAGQRDGIRHRRLPRPRGQLGQPRVRAQVRRHRPDRDRLAGRARTRHRWLVQPPGRGRLQRHRRLSGVDTCATATYSGPDNATASVPGTCTDKAGNVSAPRGHALKYDATAPTVIRRPPGSRRPTRTAGTTAPSAIGFAGTDPVSGVDVCTSTSYGGPDNAAASVSGTCTDKAGNTSGPFPFGLKYDATAPRSRPPTRTAPPNANGWYNRAVAFTSAAPTRRPAWPAARRTTYSGPDNATASVTGVLPRPRGQLGRPRLPAQVRRHGTGRDRRAAGARTRRGRLVQPRGRRSPSAGTDQLSGVDTCATVTYAGPDSGTAAAPGTCTDKAGNVSAALTPSPQVRRDRADRHRRSPGA